jgi:hypothetical protein
MAQAKLTKVQIEEFEKFKSSIPDLLGKLENELKKFSSDASFSLSFSDEVIVLVGEFYLSIIDTNQEKEFVDGITAFIGELWIDNFGGEWKLNSERNDPTFLHPVVMTDREQAVRKAPVEVIKSLKKERKKERILDSLNYTKEMTKKLDDLYDELGW